MTVHKTDAREAVPLAVQRARTMAENIGSIECADDYPHAAMVTGSFLKDVIHLLNDLADHMEDLVVVN